MSTMPFRGYLQATLAVMVATLIFALLRSSGGESVAAMLYLLAVVVSATRAGLGAAVWAAVLSFVCWNFFFVPPVGTFYIQEKKALIALLLFLSVAVTTGQLAAGARRQAMEARERESQTTALYELSLTVSAEVEVEAALNRLAEQVLQMCNAAGCAFWEIKEGSPLQLRARVVHDTRQMPDLRKPPACQIADLVMESGRVVDIHRDRHFWEKAVSSAPPQLIEGQETLNMVLASYIPLRSGDRMVGIMVVMAAAEGGPALPAHERLLNATANHAAVVMERARLLRSAAETQAQLETERLRSSLLSSVSHDLRTPLASIKAAATGLLASDSVMEDTARDTLEQSIVQNVDHLDNLVGNLLDMSRLEAGAWLPNKEDYPFTEILGTTLNRLSDSDAARLQLEIPDDLPLVPLDEVQMEQVLWNLIENALKYTSPDTPIHLTAEAHDDSFEVSLRDHGPGIPYGEEENIFRKFYRLHPEGSGSPSGSGIGLSICKGIIEAHGGTIRAANAPGDGAIFTFTLPLA